jgi:hypothetical protein
LHTLLAELQSVYGQQEVYLVIQRLFTENFHILNEGARAKENKELSAGCLQSLDDLECISHLAWVTSWTVRNSRAKGCEHKIYTAA